MYKRKLIILFSITVTVTMLTLAGWFIFRPDTAPGRFYRNTLSAATHLNLSSSYYYIAGVSGDTVFYANRRYPGHLLRTNFSLRDTSYRFPEYPFRGGSPVTVIDSPYIYFTDASSGSVYRSLSGSGYFVPLLTDVPFSQFMPLSDERGTLIALFDKINTITEVWLPERKLSPHKHLIEKQLDGIFCTEGRLHAGAGLPYLIYLYTYRNEFIIADTSFRLIRRARTIDDTDTARINVVVRGDSLFALGGGARTVNRQSRIFNGHLFVQSGIPATHESRLITAGITIIDLYELPSGRYRQTIYIPPFKNNEVTDFVVTPLAVIALQGTYAVSYPFTAPDQPSPPALFVKAMPSAGFSEAPLSSYPGR